MRMCFVEEKLRNPFYLGVSQIFPLPRAGREATGGGPENASGEEGTESTSSWLRRAGKRTRSCPFRSRTQGQDQPVPLGSSELRKEQLHHEANVLLPLPDQVQGGSCKMKNML